MLNPNTPLPDDVYQRLPGRKAVLDQEIKVDPARLISGYQLQASLLAPGSPYVWQC